MSNKKSSQKDDGGPAFPSPASEWTHPQFGMSLRDYFAGQIIAGMPNQFDYLKGVERAYQIADLMLMERAKESSA